MKFARNPITETRVHKYIRTRNNIEATATKRMRPKTKLYSFSLGCVLNGQMLFCNANSVSDFADAKR